jgi:hypothetical protein
VEDWANVDAVFDLAVNLIGNQSSRGKRYAMTAFHFRLVDHGHWVAGWIDIEQETLTVLESSNDPNNASLSAGMFATTSNRLYEEGQSYTF